LRVWRFSSCCKALGELHGSPQNLTQWELTIVASSAQVAGANLTNGEGSISKRLHAATYARTLSRIGEVPRRSLQFPQAIEDHVAMQDRSVEDRFIYPM